MPSDLTNPDRGQVVYQVVATRIGDQTGHALRARLTSKPFLIGSGKSANLILDHPDIAAVQARLLISTTRQIVLTNLGNNDVILLNGETLEAFTPMYWKPGIPLQIADFELQLVTMTVEDNPAQLERLRPALITQDNDLPADSLPTGGFIIDWGELHPASTPREHSGTTVVFENDSAEQEKTGALEATPAPVNAPAPIPESSAPPAAPGLPPLLDESPANDTQRSLGVPLAPSRVVTPSYSSLDETGRDIPSPAAPAAASPEPPALHYMDDFDLRSTEAMPPPLSQMTGPTPQPYSPSSVSVSETLPKNWQSAGRLSAQLTMNPVNLVAGERVRIPVSIRNENDRTVQVRVLVAGLPRDWNYAPKGYIELRPGQIDTLEILLETRPSRDTTLHELTIHLSDRLAPDSPLVLRLQLILKNAPNLSAILEPPIAHDRQSVFLELHNHTQVAANALLSGSTTTPGFHVTPGQFQIELPPGQRVKIPVNIQVDKRPWLRPAMLDYALQVRQSTRATLDYPGQIRVHPRLPLVPAALVLAALVAVFWIAVRLLTPPPTIDLTSAAPAPIATLPATTEQAAPALVMTNQTEMVEEVQPEATETPATAPTQPPAPTPLPTAAPTDILPTPEPLGALAFDDPRSSGCTAPIPDGWQPYTVRSGDRAFRLAVDTGTTVEEIARVNCLADPRLLQVGQVLLLPAR